MKDRGRHQSSHFNDPLTFLQRRDDVGQSAVEGGEEGQFSRVAKPYPHEHAGGAGPIGEMEEILIFADQSATLGNGVVPDIEVAGFVHVHVEDVLRIMAARIEEASEGCRKLVVDEEFHEA